MQLEHEFTVPAPIDEVWAALTEPERVAPCLPGATLTEVEGDTFKGKVKVKLGPVSLLYSGTGEFVETDQSAHRLVIKASGKDTRGAGTASATSAVTLTEGDGVTTGTVVSDVKVTGRPAQFGRGLISEVAGRLLGEFADNLSSELSPSAPAVPTEPNTAEPQATPERKEAEALDLMDVAGGPVLKRVVPVLIAIAAIVAVIMIIRAIRS